MLWHPHFFHTSVLKCPRSYFHCPSVRETCPVEIFRTITVVQLFSVVLYFFKKKLNSDLTQCVKHVNKIGFGHVPLLTVEQLKLVVEHVQNKRIQLTVRIVTESRRSTEHTWMWPIVLYLSIDRRSQLAYSSIPKDSFTMSGNLVF
jgi:hypothetical protein